MKKITFGCIVLAAAAGFIWGQNNDFYDDSPTMKLLGNRVVEVAGEVAKPGKVDLSSLPLRSVIVREAVSAADKHQFVGSYRYDGVSLFDILKDFEVLKKNKKEFGSVIDLLVVVENKTGGRVVLSWGEIFYPSVKHRNLVATQVSRIVPSLTKEQWPLPKMVRMVCGNDLISDRNISEPVRITVMSAPVSLPVQKGLEKVYSAGIKVCEDQKLTREIKTLEGLGDDLEYPAVFYGRGKGFHGIQRFKGKLLLNMLGAIFPVTPERIRQGYFIVTSLDGYRVVIGYSELMNRNDQSDFLIIDMGEVNKGRFRLFPPADFFSDRAVYAVNAVYFMMI